MHREREWRNKRRQKCGLEDVREGYGGREEGRKDVRKGDGGREDVRKGDGGREDVKKGDGGREDVRKENGGRDGERVQEKKRRRRPGRHKDGRDRSEDVHGQTSKPIGDCSSKPVGTFQDLRGGTTR